MDKSIKGLCEFFWYLEDKYRLLDFEIDGVKVWQYKRMELYYTLGRLGGIFSKAFLSTSTKQKLANIFSLLINSVTRNPFLSDKVEYAIFSHKRSKLLDSEYVDIYTKYLVDDFNKSSTKFTDFERPDFGKHIRKPNPNKKTLDAFILIENIFKKFLKVKVSDKDFLIITQVTNEINAYLEINFDLNYFLMDASKSFRINYYLYRKLFQKITPKEMYIVVAYAYGDIIKAAKDSNVFVKELQHGTFSKYHLGYSFPNRNNPLDYFPDSFLVWNDFWKKSIPLPIKTEQIIIHSFNYLECEKKKYAHIKKQKNSIIVISQGVIGGQLAKLILARFKKFEHMQIKYKLHPGEYATWKSNVALIELNKKPNVQVVKDINLYEFFAQSEYQLGVFSTALYEGVEFGCKTILADLQGIEYMEKFIEQNQLVLNYGFYTKY